MKRASNFINDIAANHMSPAKETKKAPKVHDQEEEKKQPNEMPITTKIDGNQKILVVTHGGFIMEFMNAVR